MELEFARNLARRGLAISRWLFGPAAFLFLAVAAWQSRAIFTSVIEQIRPAALLSTVLIWSALHLMSPVFSWVVLRETGSAISYPTMLAIHVGRLPARYVPGGIWHTVSRVVDLNRLGVTRSQLSLMVLLENTVPVAAALILGGLALCLAGNAHWLTFLAVLVGPMLLVGSFVLTRHRALGQSRPFALASHLRLSGIMFLFWLVAATAFFSYWSAFSAPGEIVSPLQIYGTYLLSWAAGFVSIFAPQGIGVFESVAGLLLRGTLTFSGAVVLVAGFRVAVLLADILALGILLALRSIRQVSRRSG
jgi:hypothetical protein